MRETIHELAAHLEECGLLCELVWERLKLLRRRKQAATRKAENDKCLLTAMRINGKLPVKQAQRDFIARA